MWQDMVSDVVKTKSRATRRPSSKNVSDKATRSKASKNARHARLPEAPANHMLNDAKRFARNIDERLEKLYLASLTDHKRALDILQQVIDQARDIKLEVQRIARQVGTDGIAARSTMDDWRSLAMAQLAARPLQWRPLGKVYRSVADTIPMHLALRKAATKEQVDRRRHGHDGVDDDIKSSDLDLLQAQWQLFTAFVLPLVKRQSAKKVDAQQAVQLKPSDATCAACGGLTYLSAWGGRQTRHSYVCPHCAALPKLTVVADLEIGEPKPLPLPQAPPRPQPLPATAPPLRLSARPHRFRDTANCANCANCATNCAKACAKATADQTDSGSQQNQAGQVACPGYAKAVTDAATNAVLGPI